MRKRNIIIAIILVPVAFVIIGQSQIANKQLANMRDDNLRHVLMVCNQAHVEIDGDSEAECGRLQEATNTEYLCDYTGVDCWLEVK